MMMIVLVVVVVVVVVVVGVVVSHAPQSPSLPCDSTEVSSCVIKPWYEDTAPVSFMTRTYENWHLCSAKEVGDVPGDGKSSSSSSSSSGGVCSTMSTTILCAGQRALPPVLGSSMRTQHLCLHDLDL